MKATALPIALALAAFSSPACWAQQPTKARAAEIARFVKGAKEKIEAQLKDPTSVQYKGLFVSKRADSGELILCGQVNAKNGYGGYDGFHPFISSTGSMVYWGGQIAALLPEFCGTKVFDVK
jgi:hypothetical protein